MIWVKVQERSAAYEVRMVDFDSILAMVRLGDCVVTDAHIVQCYPRIHRVDASVVVIPAGESSKSFAMYERVVRDVLGGGFKRNGRIFAIGGGVVGDLAGLVAATVHRGVDFIQVPTSLLAMVDSSVGGKVGIDLLEGKNLLGAFKNPLSVEIDLAVLKTLPPEHFTNGMAEVIKYGWIWDTELLELLKTQNLKIQSDHLREVVTRCIEIKRDVVEADFEEKSGLRAILNWGHTVGHALEALDGYENLLHGEAISIGMVAESAIAQAAGLSDLEPSEVAQLLVQYGLPTRPHNDVDLEKLVAVMMGDKKNIGDGLSMSLVKVPGECKLVHGLSAELVKTVLAELWNSSG